MSAAAGAVSLRCNSCGGWLDPTEDPGLLDCSHCGLSHLQLVGESIGVFEPVGRLGRRRASQRLREALRALGVHSPSLESAELLQLPFWQIEGKLVGWQRFQKRVEGRVPNSQSPAQPSLGERQLEERSVSQPLLSSIPACDSRGLGLLGIAHRAQHMRMRPLPAGERAGVAMAPVLRDAAAARREAREYHVAKLRPNDARGLVQRFALLRCTTRLLYYPVWKFSYLAGGRRYGAVMDGMSGDIIEGSYPHLLHRTDQAWLVAAAASAFAAGFAWILGAFALGGWALHRLRRASSVHGVADLAGWFSQELSPSVEESRPLGPRNGRPS